MQKFLFFLTIFLIVAVYLLFNAYTEAVEKNTRLETKKNALEGNIVYLEKSIEKRNKKILETTEQAKRLEQLAKKEKAKGGFDWNTLLPNDTIMHELRN